ncbi:phage tail protein [Sphingomonas sp. R86521]|uniref:phage tail protein n=1 Tax=Sphingomonas sp. R86521 TaxID=3093860 RepID=UPI0036D40704
MDPDTATRVAINAGGSDANSVGSLQFSATALPGSQFNFSTNGDHTHTVGNVPQGSNAYALAGSHYAIANSGGVTSDSQGNHTHVLQNWDNESRPVNLYVIYLINTGAGDNMAVVAPLYGAIAAFCFSLQVDEPATPWLFCDGTSQSQTALPDLYGAIGSTWGSGSGDGAFSLPNMQGIFVRGVSPGINALANFQTYSTGLPNNNQFQAATAGDHFHNVPNVPGSDTSYYNITGSHYGWDQQTQTSYSAGAHTHQCGKGNGSGGDAETRPPNVYVDFGILGDVGPDPVTDTFAVGTILNYAAPLDQAKIAASNFIYCDGSTVSRTQYATLFQAIGTSFGGGDGTSTFNLPNFVGTFPRGVNGSAVGAGYDPDASARVVQPLVTGGNSGNTVGSYQPWASGSPVNPMSTTENGAHTHQFPNVPNDSSNSAVGGSGESIWNGDSTASSTNGAHTHTITGGGDAETRSHNVACYYIIKFQ